MIPVKFAPSLNLKTKGDVGLFRKITTDVAHLTKKYRGSFSGEHGDGIVRAEFLPIMIGEKNYQLCRRIKGLFDPNNIFNPGKIVFLIHKNTSANANNRTRFFKTILFCIKNLKA